MIDPKLFDDLSQRLAASVPKGVQVLQEDLSRNFRGVIEAGLAGSVERLDRRDHSQLGAFVGNHPYR